LPSSAFHDAWAELCVAEKFQPEFSAARLAWALAVETYDTPTFARTAWLLVVLKVR
jgi:hypothetical protein